MKPGEQDVEGQLLRAYYQKFGSGYLTPGIFQRYPETRVIPAYIRTHFACARVVLDLGFGAGLWFWASFLPALERLDGIDASPEALDEADRVFEVQEVPDGYRLAHERLGEQFTLHDLHRLKSKRGSFIFQDYRQPWKTPGDAQYDLITEHGGGLGQMDSDQEVIDVVRQAAKVLKPSGRLLFVNFVMQVSPLEMRVGKAPAPAFRLTEDLFMQASEQAGLCMVDFHTVERPADMPGVETFFYGFAERPHS